eukprot:Protomagalhaensia_sp_Gyna_25__193@NODE_1093_length_2199_cov_4_415741_g865_i0_p1_GENE_NODE_1093_length_2199_cov_4_415741_g865_i0NODE_1093_length_2199_cov_4_415741_g865_i0_p1_ORF_typecomplete_len328_score26_91_NODE_1093_length_2199_cov_4_415741_g865_i011572140
MDGPLALRWSGWIWMVCFGSGCCLIHFCCTFGSAPLIDVAFTALVWTARLLCYWQVLTAVRLSALLNFELPLWQEWATTSDTTELVLLCGLTLPCLWRLAHGVPLFWMATVGRRYARFGVNQPNDLVAALLRSHPHIQPLPPPSPCEQGFISVSTIIVFAACKRGFAPVSYHELLMGPDLVKSIRICDVLVTRDWMLFFLALLVRMAAVLVHTTQLVIAVALVDLVLSLTYFSCAQAVRLLVLRRYELQEVFRDVVISWGALSNEADPVVTRMLAESVSTADLLADMERAKSRNEINEKFIPLIDCVPSLRKHGLLTSPGTLLFPMI